MHSGAEKGFSLVELLVAISILAIGLLGTATMLSTNIGSDRFAHMITVEASIATSVMEEFMARDEGDALFTSSVTGASYDLDPDTASTTRTVQGRTYSATYSIATSTPVTGVVRLSATVTSGTRSITLTSYKSVI
ncbi:MAG: prepilin-type N-terminal cleavage/methylation domain-containing protein [Deltaproteobacteria bacterium]|nr:prepilin-type N-terminal cleavage/methylation domain-containing protein [Deltaproteobacteria bacterium]